jgi:hypothetical protein
MRRKVFAVMLAAMFALSLAGQAAANTGYEGQPGNQSSGGGGGNTGYEGQPGNQSSGGH